MTLPRLIPGHVHPLMPWLLPDGLPVLARRRTRPPRVADRLFAGAHARGFAVSRRTPVARACRLSLDLLGPGGHIARSAFWALRSV